MPARNPHEMRNITRVDGAWWVRFFRGTVVLGQGYFSDSKHGGYDPALLEAQEWRDHTEDALAPQRSAAGFRTRPARTKKSGCPVGISASIRTDKRRGTQHLRFSVNYRKANGKNTNKVFEANIEHLNIPDWEAMAATAQACRDEYVWCRTHGQSFDPTKYREWRTQKLYPFIQPLKRPGAHGAQVAQ